MRKEKKLIKHIMILTGEPSGDFHASRLIREIKRRQPLVYLSGIGGPCMKQEKVELFYNIEQLSAMGLTEVLLQFRHIKKAFDTLKTQLKQHLPDLIILTDYPGFNLRVAKYVKEHYPVPIMYFITPKVWAWKKSRLLSIKKYIDHAALIFPFEEKIFKKASIPCTYVGNPLTEEYPEHGIPLFSKSVPLLMSESSPISIGLLPGSRNAEINSLFPTMVQTAQLIHYQYRQQHGEQYGQIHFLVSKASSIKIEILEKIIQNSASPQIFEIIEEPVDKVLKKAHMVIAASGTVTLEAALLEVPTLLIYKMSTISFFAARLLVKVKYAGLANLITDEELMPELLQADATADRICEKTLHMLKHLKSYKEGLKRVRQKLGNKQASKHAGSIAIHMLRQTKCCP
jgi:lipid-A-disaccharide synthase